MSEQDIKKKRNRKAIFPDVVQLRLKRGTMTKVDEVLGAGESQSKMLRAAIDREIERRKRRARDARGEAEPVPDRDDTGED